ncbi:hypothetical protein ACJMK2_024001 [Sinanodonta woodiana]|uniref:Uncharacterized protein n=1 Tax=Sinanodonta woodiana TaxID=1069815 RepID=A0ABD3T5Z3_SINWO
MVSSLCSNLVIHQQKVKDHCLFSFQMQTLEISKPVETIANEPFLLDLPNPASFREDSRGASGACDEIQPREDILIDKANLIGEFNKKEKKSISNL